MENKVTKCFRVYFEQGLEITHPVIRPVRKRTIFFCPGHIEYALDILKSTKLIEGLLCIT